jgi:hypothetical protein
VSCDCGWPWATTPEMASRMDVNAKILQLINSSKF